MKGFDKCIVKSISKTFGTKKALKNFSITFHRGEFVTFLGPSGCGKSTALNCISGLIPITSGEIYIDDECIDDSIRKVPAEKRGFGMVFQNYALFPHLNVYNNIAFGPQLTKASKEVIRERVTQVLKMVHLEGYEEKFPSQMSGGEQQRVAIARCIIMEPRLLMLDEPLSNLDAKLRIEMRYELKTLHERLQITTIYVTHDQQEALALSDRIVVMKSGDIQQVGTPTDIYGRPANLFVADFMGFKNIWPAKITGVQEKGEEMEFALVVDGILLVSRGTFSCDDRERKEGLLEAFRKGETVLTAVRPEEVMIGEAPVNAISARVRIVEYLGQVCQISAAHENGIRIDLKSESLAQVHETVPLWVAPEKILIFPKQEG
ncbi:MAG: ABC transporter ATP-binding protein [Deltaproteobacteria bacterium]|nr:ABC transporter ATP-binding protein [Deltaproteobacteria bacterium]